MKNAIPLAVLSMLLGFYSQAGFPAIPIFRDSGAIPTLAPMLDDVMPGVVNISTESTVKIRENPLLNDPFFRRFFEIPDNMPRERKSQSLGSGVIVDAVKGYVITNNHVIDKADEITVTLRDGRNIKAKVIGRDPEVDLAVVQIKAEGLKEVSFADSDKVRVGDFVVAIGNPFGLSSTVTSGIVSALGRSGLGIERFEDFIQTDASINPGNSGGALVNLEGRLVGINTAILGGGAGGNIGIGFAIPANMVRDIMLQLIKFGKVKRGQLGVVIQTLTPDLAKAFDLDVKEGVIVSEVVAESPADRAGIKPGDVVVAVNDKKVLTVSQLRNYIGLQRVGEKIDIDVIRDGKLKKIKMAISETTQAKISGGDINQRLSGVVFANMSGEHPLNGTIKGIEAVEMEPGSPAWQAGLREGDVIVSANKVLVKSLHEFLKVVKGAPRILLNVRRGRDALFIVIR